LGGWGGISREWRGGPLGSRRSALWAQRVVLERRRLVARALWWVSFAVSREIPFFHENSYVFRDVGMQRDFGKSRPRNRGPSRRGGVVSGVE
jgi:hypothetical protein